MINRHYTHDAESRWFRSTISEPKQRHLFRAPKGRKMIHTPGTVPRPVPFLGRRTRRGQPVMSVIDIILVTASSPSRVVVQFELHHYPESTKLDTSSCSLVSHVRTCSPLRPSAGGRKVHLAHRPIDFTGRRRRFERIGEHETTQCNAAHPGVFQRSDVISPQLK